MVGDIDAGDGDEIVVIAATIMTDDDDDSDDGDVDDVNGDNVCDEDD